jgi:hypothetical protein
MIDPRNVRPRRKFTPFLDGVSVRAKNALHAVGVNLCTATRDEVLAGVTLALDSHVRGCGEVTRMDLIALRRRLANTEDTRFWSVTVSRNGDDVVTIANTHLSGRAELSDEDRRVIRMAGEHLLSFVGPEEPTPFIISDDDDSEAVGNSPKQGDLSK